ncbi:MAG: hypothetical protein JWM17_1852, partial [Actinobacteria bacterium]|nr:hypothetical protein [Actinomycetota bacterium]
KSGRVVGARVASGHPPKCPLCMLPVPSPSFADQPPGDHPVEGTGYLAVPGLARAARPGALQGADHRLHPLHVVGAELALVDPSAAGLAGVRWPDAFLRHAYRTSRLGERSAEPPATGSSSERGQVQTNASMSSFKDNPFLAELRTPRPSANYRRAGDSDSGFERGQGNSRAASSTGVLTPSLLFARHRSSRAVPRCSAASQIIGWQCVDYHGLEP